MRICDVLFAFPGILLAIGIVAILGGGMANVDRRRGGLQHSDVRAPGARQHAGAQAPDVHRGGAQPRRVGRHDHRSGTSFPGTISAVVVYFSLRIGTSIITAASLSFLGMGAQPPTPEWGAMLDAARADMLTAPHEAIFPALAIFFTVLAFNLLGDGLRDALDPKIERRWRDMIDAPRSACSHPAHAIRSPMSRASPSAICTLADGAVQTGVTVVRPHAGDAFARVAARRGRRDQRLRQDAGLVQLNELGCSNRRSR